MSSALRIRRGLFDRLLATDPDAPEGLIQTCSVEQLRDTVARDLERLLNARSALLSTDPLWSALGPQVRPLRVGGQQRRAGVEQALQVARHGVTQLLDRTGLEQAFGSVRIGGQQAIKEPAADAKRAGHGSQVS